MRCQLADEHWGVIGLKWSETSCDQLGEVDGSSGDSDWSDSGSSDGDSSDDDSSDGDSSDGDSNTSDGTSDIPRLHEELKDFHGYDTTWVK